MPTETKTVSVTEFPLKSLDVLRQELRDRGVTVSDATAVRYAAIERANQIALRAALKSATGAPVTPAAEGGGA